ncbi:MAG: 50S ribosomal protein L6 [Thermoprotei archaeon]
MIVRYVSKAVKIPEGVQVSVEGKKVTVKGPAGTLTRAFDSTPVEFRVDGSQLIVEAHNIKKRDQALVGTTAAHVRNMCQGALKEYTYRLKMVYAHFPLSVKVEGETVKIENFIGERAPRLAAVAKGVRVAVEGEDVVVSGVDKESVSQTAANIQKATHIRQYDPRVFSDGIYVYSKE